MKDWDIGRLEYTAVRYHDASTTENGTLEMGVISAMCWLTDHYGLYGAWEITLKEHEHERVIAHFETSTWELEVLNWWEYLGIENEELDFYDHHGARYADE